MSHMSGTDCHRHRHHGYRCNVRNGFVLERHVPTHLEPCAQPRRKSKEAVGSGPVVAAPPSVSQ